MSHPSQVRFDVAPDLFETLRTRPLPVSMVERDGGRLFVRDLYYDTEDGALARRGVQCRIRRQSDERSTLTLDWRDAPSPAGPASRHVLHAAVDVADATAVLGGNSEPARYLQTVIDPARLYPAVELEIERYRRWARRRWRIGWQFEIRFDRVTARAGDAATQFHEVTVRRLRGGRPGLETLVAAWQTHHGLRPTLRGKADRARRALEAVRSHAMLDQVAGSREVAVVATVRGAIALWSRDRALTVPVCRGSGRDAARTALAEILGHGEGKLRLLGTVPGDGTRPMLEVWMADELPAGARDGGDASVRWLPFDQVIARVGSPAVRDPDTLAALAVATRSGLFPLTADERDGDAQPANRSRAEPADPPTDPDRSDWFIDEDLSWLEFNQRVLALAEDPGTPLRARLRFLAIFSSNLDEFFQVRVGTLRYLMARDVTEVGPDRRTPEEQLHAILVRLSPLLVRHDTCLDALGPALAEHGMRVVRWGALSEEAQEALTAVFQEQIFPALTPQAVTHAPGHPFPHLANLTLSLAATVCDDAGAPTHFMTVRVPAGFPRFLPVDPPGTFVPIEDVIRANLSALYPGRHVDAAYPFRLTRAGDLQLDEEGSANLLQAIEAEVQRRPFGPVVRLEVDRAMPATLRARLERELQFEDAGPAAPLTATDVFEIDGLLDRAALRELAAIGPAELDYPEFAPCDPIPAGVPLLAHIGEHDLLVHHPYDAFRDTVERFLVEAADDPDVLAIKMTLYRGGEQSAIVEALTRAAGAGKEVAVFVELKARFDEARNIQWVKTLERAGIHVVYGLVHLKTHAKVALVARREGDRVRRYVHIGTGNYNGATARYYTDLGLLSARDALGADINDLFNELTGASRPPQGTFRELLVAPGAMRDRFLGLIAREVEHVEAGREGNIRVKVNGLADREVIAALYRASQAGVQVDLLVRGICTLRPGVPNLSDRIRVVATVGRFLEHARIYAFGNGGVAEYYIGSADWRPRNLRRRVEVVAPVLDPAACVRLDRIFTIEWEDWTAWDMHSDGSYVRRTAPTGVVSQSAQEFWLADRTGPR